MHDYPVELYDDASITVINKPAGFVVHEGAGETGETIVDWFIKNHPDIVTPEEGEWPDPTRIGIVHRLDKDTSGVMVLAKTPQVLAHLQQQFKDRITKKTYRAIVFGEPKEPSGTIETFIGRHPKRRQEQAVLPVQVGEQTRREAITHYVLEDVWKVRAGKEQGTVSFIRFEPKTGRMHQLRVHAKHIGTPMIGDQTYTIKPAKKLSKALGIHRQLLHAASLTFMHPATGKIMTIEAPLPRDMKEMLDASHQVA